MKTCLYIDIVITTPRFQVVNMSPLALKELGDKDVD